MFYLVNQKFAHDARKAVFNELRLQLEYAVEGLTIDDIEKLEIVAALAAELACQATEHKKRSPTMQQKLEAVGVEVKF